ncbi:uncharacterized protein At1g76070-like [Phalaenopsis equestris]|uniref:uncharacterized protein At1g76070-like n=1 Tax=Phalaenopsis equestris TaxID=78828 RepID=UPI0009E58E97|nr:uncharacterized protein At1g76070-like [Phalaenopsis equestris]
MARAAKSKAASTMSHFSKAATFSVSQPSHSPGRRSDKGFSGPIVSIIPKDARHKKRNSSGRGGEPSSPKISCMGQIKKKKKKSSASEWKKEREIEKPRRRIFCFCFKGLFRRKVRPGGEPYGKEVEEKMEKQRLPEVRSSAAPRLGQMRRYQSGRETLADFDWRKTMGEKEEEEEEEDVFIPHSAPILVGGGAVALEPKKEVNLWRRRDMNPPLPLQIEKN